MCGQKKKAKGNAATRFDRSTRTKNAHKDSRTKVVRDAAISLQKQSPLLVSSHYITKRLQEDLNLEEKKVDSGEESPASSPSPVKVKAKENQDGGRSASPSPVKDKENKDGLTPVEEMKHKDGSDRSQILSPANKEIKGRKMKKALVQKTFKVVKKSLKKEKAKKDFASDSDVLTKKGKKFK